jgi:hypothetical protein
MYSIWRQVLKALRWPIARTQLLSFECYDCVLPRTSKLIFRALVCTLPFSDVFVNGRLLCFIFGQTSTSG